MASIYQEVAMRAAMLQIFNLNHLHSGSVSHQRYSLSVALHSCSHGLAEVNVGMMWTVDPGIYGR